MLPLLSLLFASLLDLVAPSPAVGAPMTGAVPAAGLRAHAAAGRAPVCVVRHSLEARYRAYGYDHIVHLQNDCRRNAVCSISTDVSPTRLTARVNAGHHREVLTFRGSPSRVFKATVACKLGG